MRKYGKSLLIAVAILFGIGTFYMQSALSASKYPDFKLVKKSGDEAEMNPVVLDGVYSQGSMNPINERMQVTAEGAHYSSEALYVEQINGDYQPFLIKQLQKEYRNFMRGKTNEPSAFFENEDTLAYGGINYDIRKLGGEPQNFTFNISVLDKKENETNTFNLDVPNNNNINNIYVEEVQMVNGELKVITVNSLAGEQDDMELRVYSFDPTDQKLINDEAVITLPNQSETQYGEMNVLRRTSHDLEKNNIVISKRVMMDKQSEEGYDVEEISSELLTFNLETNEKEEIKLTKEIPGDANPDFYDDTNIYFTWTDENGFEVASYSMESKKVENKTTIKLTNMIGENGDNGFISTVKDGKLYFVEQKIGQEMPTVQVVDLQSGDSLYKGEITIADPSAEDEDYVLYLDNIEIK